MAQRKIERRRTIIDEKTQLRFTVSQFYQVIIILAALTGIYFNLKGDLVDLKASVKGVYTKDEVNNLFKEIDKKVNDMQVQVEKLKVKTGIN